MFPFTKDTARTNPVKLMMKVELSYNGVIMTLIFLRMNIKPDALFVTSMLRQLPADSLIPTGNMKGLRRWRANPQRRLAVIGYLPLTMDTPRLKVKN